MTTIKISTNCLNNHQIYFRLPSNSLFSNLYTAPIPTRDLKQIIYNTYTDVPYLKPNGLEVRDMINVKSISFFDIGGKCVRKTKSISTNKVNKNSYIYKKIVGSTYHANKLIKQ